MIKGGDEIAAAIGKAIKHVRKYAGMGVWDTARLPTDQEIDERRRKVLAICDEIEAFAEKSKTEDTRFPDFEVLRWKLVELHAYFLIDQLQAVADAFGRAGRLNARA